MDLTPEEFEKKLKEEMLKALKPFTGMTIDEDFMPVLLGIGSAVLSKLLHDSGYFQEMWEQKLIAEGWLSPREGVTNEQT